MSKIEVDTIAPQSGTTVTLGEAGDTFTIPSGATLTNNGTASGFGISWQSVQTTGFTAVKGNAYPCNTTSAAFTVTLPATPSAGDQVQLVDYAGTFDNNNLTIDPNGEDIEGGTDNLLLTGEREGVILTYIDSTQGWIATSGINEGTDALEPLPYSVDFLVIAGGGGGGNATTSPNYASGGGGAGGYRTSTQSVSLGTVITVTVGDGGAQDASGSNSSITGSGLTTITSAGGGDGGHGGNSAGNTGTDGGSGGGGGYNAVGGSGNTPSTSPSQGNNGGTATTAGNTAGGGGGGATASGGNALTAGNATGGDGGAGTASSITGSSVTYAGGGGGGSGYSFGPGIAGGAGGAGGGGAGSNSGNGTAGTVNTGGGGGGARGGYTSGAGGKGVVILSMPDASYSGTTTGSPTVATGVSGNTVLTFTGDGSYTA
jgi:hypothetical protein